MMVAAPQNSPSPLQSLFSPLTYSLLLREQKEQRQCQTVPASPSLSPLHPRKMTEINFSPVHYLSNFRATRNSPAAMVPTTFAVSRTPLQGNLFTAGRKRQRNLNSPHDHSPASPSPIVTSSKRFCKHCSTNEESGLVVLSRNKPIKKVKLGEEQIVPVFAISESNAESTANNPKVLKMSSDGIKELQLFVGDDIFASHEE